MPERQRLNVHLYVTPYCNLQCKHCYYVPMRPGSVLDRLLTIQEMSHIITSICDRYAAAFDVEGGEFFLRDDIGCLFESVPEDYWRNVTITTNGTVKIDIGPKHLSLLDEFRVSVEGHTDDLQKDIRGVPLGPILEACASLQSSGVPITLRITATKKNYMLLPDMLERFQSLGFTRFSLYEFQSAGRGCTRADEYGLSTDDLEQVLGFLCSCNLDDRIEVLKLSLSARRVRLVQIRQEKLTSHGYKIVDLSGIPSLTVNYNGDLGVCPWVIGPLKIGTYRDTSFVSDLAGLLDAGLLDHTCEYCSAIRVLYQARE